MSRSIFWKITAPIVLLVLLSMAASLVVGIWWAAALATFLIVAAVGLISRMITRPVRQMTAAALRIASGEFGEQVRIQTHDQLGQLGRAFNEMSANLKRTMATLSGEKAKLVTVLDNITSGIVMTDDQGNVVLANGAAGRLYGFREAEATGRSLIEVVHDHEIESLRRECLTAGRTQSTQVESAGGRFLRAIAVPLTAGRPVGALIILQDLTELRSLQIMRREFVGNVSHELRTPLAAIRAIVETLQNGAIDDKPVAVDFLSKVETEVDGMTQMVNELIELSRVETGKATLDLRTGDLNQVVREVVGRLSPQAERAGVALSVDLSHESPFVAMDRDRIHQVVANIVHNAIKFTPPGGKVTVYSRPEADSVTVSVADTGLGISKQDLPHIFERFFKADRSRSSGGSGLGLAIAKHIVKAHHGSIWVQSEEGKGSTFSFRLPLEDRRETGSNKDLTKP
ncbi:MAG: hypothetical protein A2147_02155 [Chloroflexi bacterium RBG_16_57_8]|nr:MAG: hypothetical protein A2147_02155 [Chloroflexi bacterium RBG_16_57_8]